MYLIIIEFILMPIQALFLRTMPLKDPPQPCRFVLYNKQHPKVRHLLTTACSSAARTSAATTASEWASTSGHLAEASELRLEAWWWTWTRKRSKFVLSENKIWGHVLCLQSRDTSRAERVQADDGASTSEIIRTSRDGVTVTKRWPCTFGTLIKDERTCQKLTRWKRWEDTHRGTAAVWYSRRHWAWRRYGVQASPAGCKSCTSDARWRTRRAAVTHDWRGQRRPKVWSEGW